MYYTHLITKSKFRNTFSPPDGGVSVTISCYKNLAETKYYHAPRVTEYDFITNHRIQIPTFTGNLQGFFYFVCCGSANRRIASYAKPRPTLAILFADDNSAFGK